MTQGQIKKLGKYTVQFEHPPVILATATIVGPKEGQGPLADTFDKILKDGYYQEKSWEKAESKILQEAAMMAIEKAGLSVDDIDFMLSGDLLNQTISANYAARQLNIPFLGIYGACSTMFEGLALGAMIMDGGYANHVVVATSSHHDTAERQFRFPTELGVQRPLTAQWTVTGAGAAVLSRGGNGPRITHATVGRVVDAGIKDPGDMGSAMAPAAVDTIARHLQDVGRTPEDYDLIITGDLGAAGKALAIEVAKQQQIDLSRNYTDCGVLIFDPAQDAHAGGSGCACGAVVTCGHMLREMRAGRLRRILGLGTGALLSPISTQQGESIPSIGHAVVIELNPKEGQ
ncbi:MAG: stage V sporulation protein AD [Bacillota bacterium]